MKAVVDLFVLFFKTFKMRFKLEPHFKIYYIDVTQ